MEAGSSKWWRSAAFVFVASLAAPAGAQGAAKPAEAIDPGSWFGPNEYPPEAIRARTEGRTVALVQVDRDGKPTGCTIDVSSGAKALDDATCAIALRVGRFTPGRDGRGRPVAAAATLPVRWVLPDGFPVELKDGAKVMYEVAVAITLDEDGIAKGCRLLRSVPPQPNACQKAEADLPKSIPLKPYIKGKSVDGAVLTITMKYELSPPPPSPGAVSPAAPAGEAK